MEGERAMIISEIRRLSAQIKNLEQRIEELRAAAEKCTGVIDDMPKAQQTGDRVADATVKLVMAQHAYADAKLALERQRDILIDVLDPTEVEVVELRDIKGLSWRQISLMTNLSDRQCLRKYKSALQKMSHNVT